MLTLAEAQQRAIRHGDGPLLLLGGAGSGKTEALARRLARLAEEEGDADRVLLIAATPATARRLQGRAETLLRAPREELWIGTWPAICERLLRAHSTAAGLNPFFDVLGPAERLAMMLDHLDELPLRNHEIRGNPAGLLARLLAQIDELKAGSDPPEPDLAEFCAAHDRIVAESGNLDEGDVFLTLGKLLHERPDVRTDIATRFVHVMVDEYEDATSAQRSILRELAEENPNYMYAVEVRDDGSSAAGPVVGGGGPGGPSLGVSSAPPPHATRGRSGSAPTSRVKFWSSGSSSGNPRCGDGAARTRGRRRRRLRARWSTCSAREPRRGRSAC